MKTLKAFIRKLAITFGFINPDKPAKKLTRKRKQKIADYWGQYTSVKHMLEDLDNAFDLLAEMSPKKSNHQGILKNYGAYLVDPEELAANDHISKEVLDCKAYGLPSFVCNLIPKGRVEKLRDLQEFFVAQKAGSIGYLRKNKNCTYYECAMVAKPDFAKKPMEFYFYVSVNRATGDVKPLPVLINETHTTPVRNRGGRGNKHYNRHSRNAYQSHNVYRWVYPQVAPGPQQEMPKAIKEMFVVHFNLTMRREMGINVIVKKGDMRMTLSVPQHRWKDFFKDRVKVKNKNGNTKRIFHFVAAHTRADGANVKTHMRGLREFEYNGYSVSIVLPGKHGYSQSMVNLEAFDIDDLDGNGVDPTEKSVANQINQLFGG